MLFKWEKWLCVSEKFLRSRCQNRIRSAKWLQRTWGTDRRTRKVWHLWKEVGKEEGLARKSFAVRNFQLGQWVVWKQGMFMGTSGQRIWLRTFARSVMSSLGTVWAWHECLSGSWRFSCYLYSSQNVCIIYIVLKGHLSYICPWLLQSPACTMCGTCLWVCSPIIPLGLPSSKGIYKREASGINGRPCYCSWPQVPTWFSPSTPPLSILESPHPVSSWWLTCGVAQILPLE